MSAPVPGSPVAGGPPDTPPALTGDQRNPAPPADDNHGARSTTGSAGHQQGEQGLPTLLPDITALRAEVADWRTKAESAQQDIVDKIAKAIGITSGEAPTVEQVTEQLTTAQQQARERAVDLAVYRAAPTVGADPDALLDSANFRRRVADLDPAADGFAERVAAAMGEAIKTNPRLAAVPATAAPASRSGGQITGGSATGTEDLGALSVEDYIKRTRKRGN